MRLPRHTETERLDWLLAHPGHEFSRTADTAVQLRFWIGASFDHDFGPGFYCSNGGSERACIDAAIDMNVRAA